MSSIPECRSAIRNKGKKPENDQGHTAPAQRKSVRGVGGKTGGTPGEIIANRKSRDNAILVVLSYEPKTKLISFSQVSMSRDRCISISISILTFSFFFFLPRLVL